MALYYTRVPWRGHFGSGYMYEFSIPHLGVVAEYVIVKNDDHVWDETEWYWGKEEAFIEFPFEEKNGPFDTLKQARAAMFAWQAFCQRDGGCNDDAYGEDVERADYLQELYFE